jgi:hypothetical protein
MGVIICPLGFDDPDPKRPEYSFHEVDFYAYVPYVSRMRYGVKLHRLSLRKNLRTGLFEVYRYYPEGHEEVVFQGSFKEALEFGNKEVEKYWGDFGRNEPYEECQHRYPKIDRIFCPYRDSNTRRP